MMAALTLRQRQNKKSEENRRDTHGKMTLPRGLGVRENVEPLIFPQTIPYQ